MQVVFWTKDRNSDPAHYVRDALLPFCRAVCYVSECRVISRETCVVQCIDAAVWFDTQVRWLHNGETVRNGARYEMMSNEMIHSLRIADVTGDDGGTLTAVATNSLGTASHSARLSVDTSNYRQLQLDECPVNGLAEPTTSLRHWQPSATYSPTFLEAEQAVSPTQLIPGSRSCH